MTCREQRGVGVSPEHPPKNYGRPKQHGTPPEFSRIFHWQRTRVMLSASVSTQNMPVQPLNDARQARMFWDVLPFLSP